MIQIDKRLATYVGVIKQTTNKRFTIFHLLTDVIDTFHLLQTVLVIMCQPQRENDTAMLF